MDNIIQLDTLRIERHKPRKCTCDPDNKRFSVDTVNKEITCECGMTVDPFEAMEYLARNYERINESHKSLNEQRQQWIKEKPHSVMFKSLEQSYRRGLMLPSCPNCNKLFDFTQLTSWHNAEFYRKMHQLQR